MAYKESSLESFGLLIAYVLPGVIALFGIGYFSDTVRSWLDASEADAPTVGGFLYVTLASIAAGLTASTVRWLIVDTLHHWTGIRQPRWDFSRLQANVGAFDVLIEIHYKFYQFYANSLVSLAFLYFARRLSLGFFSAPLGLADVGFLLVGIVFFLGSRDTMRKYYIRVGQLLGERRRSRHKLRH